MSAFWVGFLVGALVEAVLIVGLLTISVRVWGPFTVGPPE